MFHNLCAALVYGRRASIVEPSITEHKLHVINVFPWVLVFVSLQLMADCRQVHWSLHYQRIVLCITNKQTHHN